MANDEKLARVARNLADALHAFARSRSDDDRKLVAALNTELCAARRDELEVTDADTAG